MHKRSAMKYLFLIITLLFFGNIQAENISRDEPRRLHSFESFPDFEEYLENKKVDCLAKSYGGSRAVVCFYALYEALDYELNHYYKKLRGKLNKEEKKALKTAQLAWIDLRNKTIDFNSLMLDKKYDGKHGTMYIAMHAGDAHRTISPLLINRTIMLMNWYESLIKDN